MSDGYECHSALDPVDASVGAEICKILHWRTSEVACDPALRQAGYFYLASHDSTYERMFARMQVAVKLEVTPDA